MKTRDIISTASHSLLRSKLRTTLTILAIFIGAFTLTLTSAVGNGISSYLGAQVGNLGQANLIIITSKPPASLGGGDNGPAVYQEGSATISGGDRGNIKALTSSDIATLQKNTSLTDVKPTLLLNTAYIRTATSKKYTVTPGSVPADSHLDLSAGKELDGNNTPALILPSSYVKVLGASSPQELVNAKVFVAVKDSGGKVHEEAATVAGVLQDGLIGDAGAVFTPALTNKLYADETVGLPSATTHIYAAATAKMKTTDPAKVTALKAALSAQGYKGTTLKDALGSIQTVINGITLVLNAFALIALLAAGFGIVNTLLMAVQERTKEIGLMKAMGMPRKRIFALFSLEAILIGFWGSLLGSGAAMGLGEVLNSVLSKGTLKDLPGLHLFSFSVGSFLGVMLLIMAIAFLAGVSPARRASKMSPIDALRYE